MKINVKYFALLKEQASKSFESIDTTASTPELLYKELAGQYNFSLNVSRVKVSVNNEFKSIDTVLQENDTVVFIPPVAGG